MQREASIRPFANVDTLPNQVGSVPGPAQALPHSSPDGIPETSTYVVDAPRKGWKRSPIKTLPIGDAMLSCIAGAVDISFQQHNRTNGSTVSLIHGSMVGEKLFTVSIYPNRAKEFWERPTRRELFEFAKANLDLLLRPNHAIGTWFNDYHCVHVTDVVICIRDRDVALELGRRFDQLAIFDLEARREIPISRVSQEATAKLVEVGND